MKVTVVEGGDVVCEHGTALDVHCCNCHGGFLFDSESCVCEFNEPTDEREVGDDTSRT